jgi:hypothetical protein
MRWLVIRWSDIPGGLLLMLAAMIAIIVFKLPIFEGQRAFWFLATVLPLTAVGGGFILYGRYWDVPGLLNRKCPRTLCQIPAQIIISAKLPPILCTVIDISEGGAGLSLSVSSTSGIPESFELVVEEIRRDALVEWYGCSPIRSVSNFKRSCHLS